MSVVQRFRWVWMDGDIGRLFQRLQVQKSMLILMLQLVQYNSTIEATKQIAELSANLERAHTEQIHILKRIQHNTNRLCRDRRGVTDLKPKIRRVDKTKAHLRRLQNASGYSFNLVLKGTRVYLRAEGHGSTFSVNTVRSSSRLSTTSRLNSSHLTNHAVRALPIYRSPTCVPSDPYVSSSFSASDPHKAAMLGVLDQKVQDWNGHRREGFGSLHLYGHYSALDSRHAASNTGSSNKFDMYIFEKVLVLLRNESAGREAQFNNNTRGNIQFSAQWRLPTGGAVMVFRCDDIIDIKDRNFFNSVAIAYRCCLQLSWETEADEYCHSQIKIGFPLDSVRKEWHAALKLGLF
ncbi:hypothetical protein FPQ18DRAFT_329352 [Pyronema domesticum]|uniref:Uncharacterized protein n=1 Tax=Pyronema omphalodes (strain CBS 100304) TaxID=1076935 RepID=U4LGE6_PYROM|nr:hypothetical protein FPQ18DRAFT_329352 [Pyronema domesticum]CCX10694.1 Similar to hypothetical protein SNOG_06161 [Phaeosphaeria nodorum SN15]; acc. no. XP_001796543 [Pyronema omphalodes CBS 100304]